MEYIHTKTIERENAVIRVYSPVLDEAETRRRYEEIKKAAIALLKA